MKQDTVPTKLRGPAGTQVTVTIKRQGVPDLFDVKITRGIVPTTSVQGAYMLDNTDIGYIYINRFAATTSSDVLRAAQRLKKEGMKKLVLDLRNNPGGYMDQAYQLADEFIKSGGPIVFTKDRSGNIQERFDPRPGGFLEDVPVVVLINGSSASASEIVSGAIQDLDRGLIVGETSFGKGLVQRIFPLPDGSGVKFTIARYYTPSGRLIQRPYKNKKELFAAEGRSQDLTEGANFEHKNEADTGRPSFQTLNGRRVLGGGGIVPDYVVKGDTTRTKLYDTLARRGVFFEAADKFSLAKGQEIRTKYNKDFKTYLKGYTVGDDYLKTLKDLLAEKKIEWNEENFKTDQKLIANTMKYCLANYLWNWGDAGFIYALLQSKQLEKAISLFPEAAKIAKAK